MEARVSCGQADHLEGIQSHESEHHRFLPPPAISSSRPWFVATHHGHRVGSSFRVCDDGAVHGCFTHKAATATNRPCSPVSECNADVD